MTTTKARLDELTALRVWGVAQVAEALNVIPDTIHTWRHRGLLPLADEKPGRGELWYPETIIQWARNTDRWPH